MKKNLSHTIASTCRKQMYVSLGLLQRNKDFTTPLEQVNQMISRFLWLVPSFTMKEEFKKLQNFYASVSPHVFTLYCKSRLVRLCPYSADPVTYVFKCYYTTEYF